MSGIDLIQPQDLAVPKGEYTPVSRVAGGSLVFIAGQVAIGLDGEVVGRDDFAVQFRATIDNLRRALASVGQDFDSIVKLSTYMVDAENLVSFNRLRKETFPGLFSDGRYPPNTLVVVRQLARPELLIEIEAIAAEVKPLV